MKIMYGELAKYWHMLSPPIDYAEEAKIFRGVFFEFATNAKTVLELGSGGGNNAFHLARDYQMTLSDLSEDMLRVSKRLLPNRPHHHGDMRTLQLEEEFDIVFAHDAITYMTTRQDLLASLRTAFLHCRPGGIVVLVPDETKERFVPSDESEESQLGSIYFHYREFVRDEDPSDELCTTDYTFTVRNQDGGTARVLHEQHTHGLFSHSVWMETIELAGFSPRSKIYEHSELPKGYEIFIGKKH